MSLLNSFPGKGDAGNMLEDSLLDETGRLTLAYRDLSRIPLEVSKKFAARTQELDLSYNRFSYPLTIIVDHNRLVTQ